MRFHEFPHNTGGLDELLTGPGPVSKRIVVAVIPCARDHLRENVDFGTKYKCLYFVLIDLCSAFTAWKDDAAPGVNSVHVSFPRLAWTTLKSRGPACDQIWLGKRFSDE